MKTIRQREQQDEIDSFDLRSAPQCGLSDDFCRYVDDAAHLLYEQWPKGGSVSDYRQKLLGDNNTAHIVSLPCSYLLLDKQRQLVGHGRLTECFEGRGGNAAAATYIITKPRLKGYGTVLMKRLELEAVKLGYHYMYLWTSSAVLFYNKLGYNRTERVSLHSACLKTLQNDQVGLLDAMLAKRTATNTRKKETLTLPPDAATENDVWLQKRLVESVASIIISLECRRKELMATIRQYPSYIYWEYHLQSIPWQQQIGPSCGLTALRMICDHYLGSSQGINSKLPSLLCEAQSKGYSLDGEIFDVQNMIQLANFCGLKSNLLSFHSVSAADIFCGLKSGGSFIVPYDSQPYTKKPFKNEGKSAHYGLIVGLMIGRQGTKEETENASVTPSLVELMHTDNINGAGQILLLVQHGLSPQLAIAPITDFVSSNEQLRTVDLTKCKLLDQLTLNLSGHLVQCNNEP
jgi:N-acetylglutamate synthase-like GNAT family acetyltransferase